MARRDANRNSLDALTTTSILAWSEPERIAIPQHQQHIVASDVCQHISPSTTSPTPEQQSFVCATHLWISQSTWVNGHTFERDKHNIEPSVPTSTSQEWNRSFSVAR